MRKICETLELNELKEYFFVVIISTYRGKLLLSRHRERTTWEFQGGHIEKKESPLEAAERELYEESGALEYEIKPLCDYMVRDPDTGEGDGGMLLTAEIQSLGNLPESEIGEFRSFDYMPEDLTYPDILPVLFDKWKEISEI